MSQLSDADQLAAQCADTMWLDDEASKALGMHIVTVREGYADVCMTVRENMSNGHGMCHGGLIFTLADSAFAFACNSQNHVTVASGASIEFLRPAFTNDVLTASAGVVNQGKKNGLYDVVVRDQNEKIIAQFRGRSTRIRGAVLAD